MNSVVCPYCGQPAQWLPDREVYSKSYGGYVYACIPCDAHIGCHKQGDHKAPKGSLADKGLRALRVQAHALFDPLWQAARRERGWSKSKSRRIAYRWLATGLGIDPKDCHIGMLRDDDVSRVIELCSSVYENRGRNAAKK